MSEQLFIASIVYMILAVGIGTLLIGSNIEFIGDDWEIHDVRIDWPKVWGGVALLASAGAVALIGWPA